MRAMASLVTQTLFHSFQAHYYKVLRAVRTGDPRANHYLTRETCETLCQLVRMSRGKEDILTCLIFRILLYTKYEQSQEMLQFRERNSALAAGLFAAEEPHLKKQKRRRQRKERQLTQNVERWGPIEAMGGGESEEEVVRFLADVL